MERTFMNRGDRYNGRPKRPQLRTKFDSRGFKSEPNTGPVNRRNPRQQTYQPINQRRQQTRAVYFENSQNNRRGGQPPRQDRRAPVNDADAESQWFKVTIPSGTKAGKDFLLTSLQAMCDKPFVPYNYAEEGQTIMFYVQGRDTSEAIRACNRRIPNQHGFSITILTKRTEMPFTTMNDTTKAHIQECMSRRYNAATRVLDLSKFHKDPYLKEQGLFVPLQRPSMLLAVLSIVKDKIPDLVGLNLSENKISDLVPFKTLAKSCRTLKSLNLSKNEIKNFNDLDNLKGLELEELILANNPCTARLKDQSSYISSIRSRFPNIVFLDEKSLPAPIRFDLGDSTSLPATLGSCIPSDAHSFVTGFVIEYINLYDTDDRSGLVNAYHDEAVFSLCIGTASSGNRPEKFFTPIMFQESRNLLKIKGESSKVRYFKRGRESIVSTLKAFPKTTHERESLTVDVFVCGPRLINVVVTGIYRETTKNGLQSRAFCRNFLIIPNLIINDMLSLTNATVEQIQKYGKAVESSKMMDQPSSSSQPSLPSGDVPASQYINKGQLVKQFSEVTGLNSAFSLQCLEEHNYDMAAGIPRPGQNVPVSNIHPAANNPQMTPAPQMRQAPQMPATHMNPPVSQIAHQSSPAQHQLIHHPPNQQGMMAPPSTNASPAVSVMPQMPQISNQMQGYMPSQNQSSLHGPLAFLERTTSNIGMPDPRRSN